MPSEVTTVGSEQSVEELRRQLAEALETQTATAAILRVIASSPGDLTPVLSAVAESAARLCDAFDALVLLRKGDELHTLAHHVPIPARPGGPIARDWVIGRAFLDRTQVQVADLTTAGADFARGQAMAVRDGFRTSLAIPLQRQKGEPVGAICVRRTEVRPFTEKQIGLLQTFADQAVIAIENTRLFEAEQASKRELQESLEYQTATSEVLGVISRSKFDLQPVLDIIARIASQLCVAEDTTILLREGTDLRIAAHHGAIPIHLDEKRPIGRGWVAGRTVADRLAIHVPDLTLAGDEFPLGRKLADESGHRTTLGVPLLREGDAVGCLLLRRNVAQPFADKQIALVQTFADQAVIAIENTRLFEEVQASKSELQESLEYQTAMSDVLVVISRSPNELQPVLDTIVLVAQRLCQAEYALIHTRRDDDLLHLAASSSADPAFVEWVMENPIKAGDGSNSGLVLLEKKTVHWPDALAEPKFSAFKLREQSKARTMLGVPVQREGQVVAVLFLARTTVKPFSQRQIKLVETFADQAVIAIENTRLFEAEQESKRELAESLEEQTATSEVLQVISSSAGELLPVFAAILKNAVQICGAEY